MDTLLLKTNHRGSSLMREENRKIKRQENLRRTKQARGISVQDKRKIPENLELTNESIHAPSVNKKKPSCPISNKPSRIDLLREWRAKKIQNKACEERNKKAPFVVKHIVYKDSQKSGKAGKENKESSISKIPDKKNDKPARILRERNVDVTSNVSKNPQIIKPVQKKSYSQWKKTQVQQDAQKPLVKTRSTKNAVAENKQNKCPLKQQFQNTRTRPTTRSMKNNKNKTSNDIQKSTTVNAKKESKGQKEKENVPKEEDLPKTQNSQKHSDNINETYNVNIDKENMVGPEKLNIFSVLSATTTNTEDVSYVTDESTTEPLVNEKTDFEPPKGLFTDFKFDQKVILEAISDFVPVNSNPTESKLFTTNITAIEKKESDCEDETDARKSPVENSSLSKLETKTPISAFQEREGLASRKTPTSTPKRLSMASGKRSSLTPNPMNFLHKIEDPVALKSETPKVAEKTQSRVSKVLAVNIQEKEEEESETVKHFTNLVAAEEAKFKVNLDKWEVILEEKSAPEEYQGNILAAIGQAQLFMRKRFNQFKELINLHKDKTAEKAAHASDLDGFWEMIYYQVSDVHKRFDELNKLEEKQWVKEESEQQSKKKVVKKPKPKKAITTKPTASKAGASKRSDFAKFRQQMMAKKKAEEQNTDGDFVKILTPVQDANKGTVPLRHSIRHLPDTPKEASNVCMVFPLTNTTNLTSEESSRDAAKEPTPPTPKSETKSNDEETLKPLRRSTRKTPSKYNSTNFTEIHKKPEDVACNLFETNEQKITEEDGESEFTKYLSKTLMPGHPVQRDLLTSFDTPQMDKTKGNKPSVTTDDLMMFASPIVQPVFTDASESDSTGKSNVGDLLL